MPVPIEEGYFRVQDGAGAPPILLGSYSRAANTYFWPRRKRCPITMEPVEDCELSTEGTLYSWTFVYMPTLGSMNVDAGGGFGVGQVDLPEGVRVQALIDGDFGDWSVGMPMRLTTRKVGSDETGNDVCTIAFTPATGVK